MAKAKTEEVKEVRKAKSKDKAELSEVSTETEPQEAEAKVVTKKAGPKSAKAVQAAEKEAERKEKATEKIDQPAAKAKPQKANPLKAHGKKYRQLAEQVDKSKAYELSEAIELARKTSPVKFDASVEIHVNLGVDPRQADQMVRASVVLPAGTGKSLRVAVLAPSTEQAKAKTAGADVVGEDDLVKQIEAGKIDFDILIATPGVMAKLGKLAKVLGPKGLMPNPKSGTVTTAVAEAVKAAKTGRVEFRIDKQSIVHQSIGKVSFASADLEQNLIAFVNALMGAKPAAAKGTYVKRMNLTTSMGPGIRLNHSQVIATANQAK
jgi:large subunit ribosomal protein L1